jgi:hypothetical protein
VNTVAQRRATAARELSATAPSGKPENCSRINEFTASPNAVMYGDRRSWDEATFTYLHRKHERGTVIERAHVTYRK